MARAHLSTRAASRAWARLSRDAVLVKLGGELLEEPGRLQQIAESLAQLALTGPLIVVHGGGREIDTALARQGLKKQSVDGLRITDADTLSVVVAVLAGSINTRLVSAIVSAGAAAVGLTGADAAIGLVERVAAHVASDGRTVDLGLVGQPIAESKPRLLIDLCERGYVPVIASLGITADGDVMNVNADTLAAHLAATAGVARLMIAGATAGVLDAEGRMIPLIEAQNIGSFIEGGHASGGMVAKLIACRDALRHGVGEVLIVDGREASNLERGHGTMVTGLRRKGLSRPQTPRRTHE